MKQQKEANSQRETESVKQERGWNNSQNSEKKHA